MADKKMSAGAASPEEASDFIRDIVDTDLRSGKHQQVVTRFPPEPNGFMHIGHAKSVVLNFGVAQERSGRCHLRFDDTNPLKEEQRYVDAFQEDVRWLGYDWGDHLHYASDYFSQLYDFANALIDAGKAYVDSASEQEIRLARGTVKTPGQPSPCRDRSVAENRALFARMRAGEFPDGAHVLRAKIDLASPNMKMRDPLLYRIRHVRHQRTGDAWCIYPLYDFTHCLSDALEGVTHSICTLEFENNRELYDWILRALDTPCRPQQIEFARLGLNHTVLSKRKLLQLVEERHVVGWDDPRMPTIAGMRRRGYTPASIRAFCGAIGVARAANVVDIAQLEHCVRHDLNGQAPRVMAVLDPLRLVIENWEEQHVESLQAPYFPDDPPKLGYREVPFGKTLYIERDDFMESPPRKFFRLAPGSEVRLRWGYIIRCTEVRKNPQGEVVEVRCVVDPESRGGNPADGRKIKGTIHWVSASHALPATVRLYDRLFTVTDPEADKDVDFRVHLNPHSLESTQAYVEPSLRGAPVGKCFQFERKGYFCVDPDTHGDQLVFNRTVPLRDTWSKIATKLAQGAG